MAATVSPATASARRFTRSDLRIQSITGTCPHAVDDEPTVGR